jgi:hypothetical protein
MRPVEEDTMTLDTWKRALVHEVETAAERRAEQAQGVRDDPRIATSQKALFDLADGLKGLPADNPALAALYREESELSRIEAAADDPERRYHEAREELLQAIGFEHRPFDTPEQFLDVLRARADETITEFRLG